MKTLLINKFSSSTEKVALFRSLFRGRDDVFARRFESVKTGKSGYQPACAMEWVRGICQKPKIKCAACPMRQLEPLTDEVIFNHLRGVDKRGKPYVIGIYPLMQDEQCWFAAADFDKATWQDDVRAVRETCARLGFSAAVERSRSGNGAHLWWFFDCALPAFLARSFVSGILTATIDCRPEIGLDSYDRIFPNQNTMPKGNFGNLIALPLQHAARASGNSEFVDEDFTSYPDQWAYLASIQRTHRSDVERFVGEAVAQETVLPVTSVPEEETTAVEPWLFKMAKKKFAIPEPRPEKIKATLANKLYFSKAEISPLIRGYLVRLASFQNPEFHQAQAMRLNTYGKPRIISCAEETAEWLALPRGCRERVERWLDENGVALEIDDRRESGTPIDVVFHGELRPRQKDVAKKMSATDMGVLSAGTAFGKTVLAAWLVAARKVNTLILVNRQQLQEQWVARLATFLELPAKEIGRIGGGHKKQTGVIDVALMQSLVRNDEVKYDLSKYGQVIVDECHAVPAPSFERVLKEVHAKFVMGLSATPVRKDGHQPIISMQLGPIRCRVDARARGREEPFRHVVVVCPTRFHLPLGDVREEKPLAFTEICDLLVRDEARNRQIVTDVKAALAEGRSPVVITDRREHVETLAGMLKDSVAHLLVLQGGMGKRQRKTIFDELANIPPDESRLLLATGQYIGEGFDDARLDTMFLTMPISWKGRLTQYAGRLHRLCVGKSEVRIYDYADLDVSMLARMFNKRCRGYVSIGYEILQPLPTTPGWPERVLMPVNPQWQETYAASVRRLCRDGVDEQLADLFIYAAWKHVAETAPDEERARSAAEKFLWRRLQTLPETKDRFVLNGKLPIPFSGDGTMEVDFLSQELRLAVEIDGPQHLVSDAYRRDRRKDLLLQQNGYLVLRFLADDLSADLAVVLDTILQAIQHVRDCVDKG